MLFYRLLAAGQKGFEGLQLSLAGVQVCSLVLGVLGKGREGQWAARRAPRGKGSPWGGVPMAKTPPQGTWCWRKGFLCGSHASIMPLLTEKRLVATTAGTTPASRRKSSPRHNPVWPLEQLRQQVWAAIKAMPAPPPPSAHNQQ